MISATHADGRSVRRGTLAVEREGLTFESRGAPAADPIHIPVGVIRAASVEGRGSRWDAVPRKRVRIDLTGGAVHWFVVDHPDATVALLDAVTADAAPHPAVIERRRRDADRRSPLRLLRSQLLVAVLVAAAPVMRALGPGPVDVVDVLLLAAVILVAAVVLTELWRHRRHRRSP